MSLVDLLLIALALVFAFSGFRQGLLVSATSFLGFLGGAVLGAQLSGPVADRLDSTPVTRVFAALVVVLAGALLGQLLAGAVGRAVRSRLTWEPAEVFDSVAGAVVSVVAVLLVAWLWPAARKPRQLSLEEQIASRPPGSFPVPPIDLQVPPSPRARRAVAERAPATVGGDPDSKEV